MQDPGFSPQSHTQKKQSSYIVLVTSFDAVVITFIYFVDGVCGNAHVRATSWIRRS